MLWWLWLGTFLILLIAIVPLFFENKFKYRSLAIGGGLLYLWSFFLLPWVSLDIICILDAISGGLAPLLEALGVTVDVISTLFGSEDVQALVDSGTLIGHYAFHPSGALLTVYYPVTQINSFFLTVLWMPAVYAVIVVIFGTLSFLPIFRGILKTISALLSVVGLLIVMPLLVVGLPLIDSWGTAGEFIPGLAAWILGAHLGIGAWLALLAALPMMIIGGERIYAGLQEEAAEFGRASDENAPGIGAILNVPGKAWILIGSLVFLVAFFFLPWIEYDSLNYQTNITGLNTMADTISGPLCALQGLDSDCELYDPPWPFMDANLQEVQAKLAQGDTLTGTTLSLHPFSTNMVMLIALYGAVAIAIINLIWAVIFLTQFDNSDDMPINHIIIAFSTPLLFVFGVALLLHYPDVEMFGTVKNYPLELLMNIATAKVGYGAIIGIFSLFLVVLGGFREEIDFLNDHTVRVVVLGVALGFFVALGLLVLGLVLRSTDACDFGYVEPPPAAATPIPTATATPTSTPAYPPTPFRTTPNANLVTVCPGGEATLPWDVYIPPLPQSADILFAFDLSPSMEDTISEAQRSALNLMQTIAGSVEDVRFGVIGFSDMVDYPYVLVQPLTSDFASVQSGVNQLRLQEGAAEAYVRVMYESYSDQSIGWGENSRRFLVFFADEPIEPDDPGRDGIFETADDLDVNSIHNQLINNNIYMIFIGGDTDQVTFDYWNNLSTQTGGMGVLLSDASELTVLVNNVITTVSRHIDALNASATTGSFRNWVSSTPLTDLDVGIEGINVRMDVVLIVPEDFYTPGNYELIITALGDGALYATKEISVIIPEDCFKP